ncbi:MAG: hypothetical protein ABSD88_00550 [Candidatus Korobacteraceae bacterium]|jgi:hypothetical protein
MEFALEAKWNCSRSCSQNGCWRYSRLLLWLFVGEPEWAEKTLVAFFAAKRPQQGDHGQKSFMHQAMRPSDIAAATSRAGQNSFHVLPQWRLLDRRPKFIVERLRFGARPCDTNASQS